MNLYRKIYAGVLRTHIMMLVITIALLFFTFDFWIGVPVFILGNILSNLNTPIFIQGVCISIAVGLLFSIFFIPFHLKVANIIGELKQESTMQVFTRLHLVFILFIAIIFYFILTFNLWAQG